MFLKQPFGNETEKAPLKDSPSKRIPNSSIVSTPRYQTIIRKGTDIQIYSGEYRDGLENSANASSEHN